MTKGWKIIISVVLILLVLGTVAMAVGLLTGAEMNRIYQVLDNRYHIQMYYDYLVNELIPYIQTVMYA